MSTTQQPQLDSLTFEQSYEIWLHQKKLYNNSYQYLIGFENSLTQIAVKDGKIKSRKHYSYQTELDSVEWICEPNFERCLYTKQIDSLRKKEDRGLKNLMVQHMKEHTTTHFKSNFFNCWEEYDEFVGRHKLYAVEAISMGDLYKECKELLNRKLNESGSELRHSFTTNREGIICSCYAIQPYLSAHGDEFKEGFRIKYFEWNQD
ncbi:hypothetical protein [Marivirga sp.]|uniref:hypothetical protein n=1 Tax=Marivirga sp. TaxID=2018662 RepID=UPI003DA711EF